MSAIEWTNTTWNPWVGCSLMSPGCTNCYAMRMAERVERCGIPHYAGTTKPTKTGPVWTGTVNRASEAKFSEPLRWRRARMVFVNSMSDFFHPAVPRDWQDEALDIMRRCPQHTFQILTKRPDLIDHALPPNVWLGVSVEDRQRKHRIDELRCTGARVRWLSCEPLLEDLGKLDLAGIDWLVVGGESGPRARPFDPAWARSIRDQCRAWGKRFFMKQMGGRTRPLPPIPPDLMVREWPEARP